MATVLIRKCARTLVCALAVSIALVAAVPPTAQALPSPSPAKTASLGGDVVYDLAVLDNGRVIVGGRFTSVGAFARSNLGAILANGNADSEFAPTTNGAVHAVAVSEDGNRVFIGGTFTEVNGQPRRHLAAINADTGALVGGWQADTTGRTPMVSSLAVSGDRLYVGGRFNGIDGTGREKLAAVDVSSGNLESWSTWVNGAVNEVRVAPDGDTVWVGGEFTKIRGIARPYFGGIDPVTGRPTSFNGLNNSSRLITLAISPDGEWVYTANNANRTNAYRISQSQAPVWTRHTDGNVQAIAGSGTHVYLGGHYTAFQDDDARRVFFAAVNRSTGDTTSWDPDATGFHKGTWSLVIDGGRLYAGGGFTHFDGVKQRLFAKFDGTA